MYDEIPVGPTGEFPDGKMRDDDDGELRIAIGTHRGNVVFELGAGTKWFACDPATARQIAATIFNKAADIDGKGPRLEFLS